MHRDSTNAMLPNISALRNHMYYHALRSLLISRWRNPYSHCVESQRSGIPDLPSNRGGVPRGRRQEIPSGPARRDIVDAYNPRVVGSAAIVSRRCNKCKENMYSNHHAGGDGRVRVRVRRRHRCGSGGYVDVTWNSCFREDGKVFAQLTVT